MGGGGGCTRMKGSFEDEAAGGMLAGGTLEGLTGGMGPGTDGAFGFLPMG